MTLEEWKEKVKAVGGRVRKQTVTKTYERYIAIYKDGWMFGFYHQQKDGKENSYRFAGYSKELNVFVAYHKETTILLKTKSGKTSWTRKQDAQAAITFALKDVRKNINRLIATGKAYDFVDAKNLIPRMEDLLNYVVGSYEDFKKIEKKEIRHGVASCEGQIYEVPVNTPWTSGPWSESYWSA
jgi:hypothetical protein